MAYVPGSGGGGQLGNKNAEKWTEDKALALGESLLAWLKDPKHFYLKEFLFIENDYDRELINRLGRKFKSFAEIVKRAKDIQRTKIEMLTMAGIIKPIPGLFIMKANHNMSEINNSDDFNFEISENTSISQFLTKATQTTLVYSKTLDMLSRSKRVIINRGGTRSSKTYSLAQMFIDYLFTGRIGDQDISGNIGVFRKALPHLKDTLLQDFLTIIEERKIQIGLDIKWHQTDKYFQRANRKIIYGGVNTEQEAQKVRGLGLGAFWLNEANELSFELFKQLYMRGNEGVLSFIDFNPSDENVWINEELEKKRAKEIGDVGVIISSFEDNRFLSEERKQRIRELRELDPEYWEIYGLGNYGVVAGLIYQKWQEFEELPENKKFIKFYGEDFGFSNSETAIVEIHWEVGTINLYIYEKLYSLGLESFDVIEQTKIANPDNDIMFGDSEDARILSDLRTAGVNIYRPKKAVLANINLTKSFNLFFHKDSINLQKEAKTYKWMKQEGKRINKPLKFMDHLMNAMQYGVRGFINTYGRKYKILAEIMKLRNIKD